jgi:cysteinyl-tRNA synthetase
MIRFYNTQTKSIEAFNPIKPHHVGIYHCGPTVYDRAHLGNLCPFIYWDVMRRMFESIGYEVNQVMNFTDVGHIVSDADQGDDKMVSALIKAGKELTIENLHIHGRQIAKTYLDDLDALNIKTPHHLPYASQHIKEDIAIIQKLLESGHAYQVDDAIYFDTSSIDNYDTFDVHGDLDQKHTRVTSSKEKISNRDFSLWKFSDPESNIGWDSPWGKGFPGWHIECSAMAWRYLGESFDIHTGGIEHISIHHTNEIAQSETAFNQPMARMWLHNNHLQLNGEKISKSEGNVMYLDELSAHGLHPMDYRYLILTSHYRSEQNLTLNSLRSARKARHTLAKQFAGITTVNPSSADITENPAMKQLSVDLNTPQALASIRLQSKASDNHEIAFYIATEILGLDFSDLHQSTEISFDTLPANVAELLHRRSAAREARDFTSADEIRAEITKLGYLVEDNPNGTQKITKK